MGVLLLVRIDSTELPLETCIAREDGIEVGEHSSHSLVHGLAMNFEETSLVR